MRPLQTPADASTIEIRITEPNQLFNSLDPTPFPEKDLDADAEEFIVSWATEHPRRAPLRLRVHMSKASTEANVGDRITDGVHRFFAYRSQMSRLRLRRLLSEGRNAMMIGLLFVSGCVVAADQVPRLLGDGRGITILRESLVIAGWVAMWRPMEIFLYAWWPLRHERRVYDRLSRCAVEVIEPTTPQGV